MNREARLQYECVKWFRETYPDRKDDIVMIHNETNKGAYYMSMGMSKSASDLVIFSGNGVLFAETKAEGSRHNVAHLEAQYIWLYHKYWISRNYGGCFFSSLLTFQTLVACFMSDGHGWRHVCLSTLTEMDKIIQVNKKKGNKTAKVELEKHYE